MAKRGRKKTTNKVKKEYENESYEMSLRNKIYIVIGILAFFLIFYLLTIYITNKNSDKDTTDDTPKEVSISYKNIILGRSFDMSDGEYLVVYYDTSDEELSSTISDAISTYGSNIDNLTVYTVDMHNALNSSFTSDTSNNNPTNASELKINGPTLIKFNNHEVVDYIEGTDGIKDYLS